MHGTEVSVILSADVHLRVFYNDVGDLKGLDGKGHLTIVADCLQDAWK